MKKEKYYLTGIMAGLILNISLSLVLGMFVFKNTPAIGVAIATVATDIAIFVYLIIITWKWVYKALFNINTVKLLVAGAAMLASSIGMHFILNKIVLSSALSSAQMMLIELVSTLAVDVIIYLGICLILKEDLIYSFIRKKPKEI